jgi:hypothetical protein
MNVYILPLEYISNISKFGINTNTFWQLSSDNKFTYNILVNYVIYGKDDPYESLERGHYAIGQFYIQPTINQPEVHKNSPKINVFDQQREGIQKVYSYFNDSGTTSYLLIDVPSNISSNSKYYMKCTVI